MPDPAGSVALVGMHGGEWFGAAAGRALREATVLVGSRRHLQTLAEVGSAKRVELSGDLGQLLDDVARFCDSGESVCVLVSGDPGFFGLARVATARFGADRLSVHPAPSSVALAFAELGVPWDDAMVVSAHGRPVQPAVDAVHSHPKVAVLCSPETPPEELGRRLVDGRCGQRAVAVLSRLGERDSSRWHGDLVGLAAGRFDPLSVAIFEAPDATRTRPGIAWGRPDSEFAHRDGMITKAEVRAVVLGKLQLPTAGVLWDVGAGSGSVIAECCRLAPGLRAFAVERRPDDVVRLSQNLSGTAATVVAGTAPEVLSGLPDPDRVFVGGGGISVLEAALRRLRPAGAVVATFASVGRAAEAANLLGQLVQVSISRGVPVGEDSVRLAAENPVFVCWGPTP